MWCPVVLDDVQPGDYLELTDSDGLRVCGWLAAIRWKERKLVIDTPLEGFDGQEIGAAMTTRWLIETWEVRAMRRLEGGYGDGQAAED